MLPSLGDQCLNVTWPNLGGKCLNTTWFNLGGKCLNATWHKLGSQCLNAMWHLTNQTMFDQSIRFWLVTLIITTWNHPYNHQLYTYCLGTLKNPKKIKWTKSPNCLSNGFLIPLGANHYPKLLSLLKTHYNGTITKVVCKVI
jgi:hypothetical protein